MLEVSNHGVGFAYSDAGLMQTTVNIRNLSATGYVTYKVHHVINPDQNHNSRFVRGQS